MRTIGIIGFGALGQQMLAFLAPAQLPDRVLLFDDNMHSKGGEDSFPFDSFLDSRFADCEFYVGLGYHHLVRRKSILADLRTANRRVPAFVHPQCYVAASCLTGEGCFVYPLCNLGHEVELGMGVLLNNSVVVSHGSRIGAAAYLSPGVILSGNVTVGDTVFIGSGAVVANGRHVGAGARVGIGTVVTRDVPEGASVIGSPQRLLARPIGIE